MSSCPYFLSQKFIRQLIFILFSSPLVLRRYGENAQTGSSVTLTLETFYMAKNCLVCAQVISERSRDLLCTDCLSAPSKSAFICHARKRNVEAQLRKMIDVCNSCGGYLTTTVSRSQWRKWFFSFFFFVMITILRMRNTGKWTISLFFFVSLSLSDDDPSRRARAASAMRWMSLQPSRTRAISVRSSHPLTKCVAKT